MNPNDSPQEGKKLFRDSNGRAIEDVFEGMNVEDAKRDVVGKVAFVQMGDSNAATAGGHQEDGGSLVRNFKQALGLSDEPDVRSDIRRRLLRSGYLKVDGSGLTNRDVYVAADSVANVTGDTVRLSVLSENIPSDLQDNSPTTQSVIPR